MKKTVILLLLLNITDILNAQFQANLDYEDTDKFMNPIFSGDYPDPSILKDGDDYYVVHSSFEYYPGLLIWHSKDLIYWEPVTSALHKYVGSVWAPDITKYNGSYYIYFPANNTNYVIKANSIEGPWSDPIDLEIGNIDPGHITDDKGNRYLYFSSGEYVPLAKDGLSVAGELQDAYNGWPIPRNWSIECFCLEGPKLIKRGNYYYLTVAEGGTAGPPTGHMVISARSKSPLGPWENSPYNPIIRTEGDNKKWNSVGHGTIFEGENDHWLMIFHGYEREHYNMGRQTLLLPIEWTEDGWYKIPEKAKIDEPIKKASMETKKNKVNLNDDFSEKHLKPQWKFFGEYNEHRFELTKRGLEIEAKGNSIGESSPLLVMPSNHSYSAEVELEIEGNATAGLLMFYNNQNYSGILSDGQDILANIKGWQFPTEKGVSSDHIFLRLKNNDNIVDMFYSLDGKKWIKIKNSLEVSSFQHNVLGGFLSLRIGISSFGNGKIIVKNFDYKAIE